MKIQIEVVTTYNNFSCFTWDKETEEGACDELKALVQKYKDADWDDKEEIGRELSEWAQKDAFQIQPWFDSLHVSYPDGEEEDEWITPGAVDNDGTDKDIRDFYEKEILKNKVVVLLDNEMKHGGWEATVESNKPFNIHALSIAGGEMTYGFDTLEFDGNGEGNYSEVHCYCP